MSFINPAELELVEIFSWYDGMVVFGLFKKMSGECVIRYWVDACDDQVGFAYVLVSKSDVQQFKADAISSRGLIASKKCSVASYKLTEETDRRVLHSQPFEVIDFDELDEDLLPSLDIYFTQAYSQA